MSLADTTAVKTKIESAGALSGHVFVSKTSPDGVVQALPYVLIHPTAGDDEQTRYTGPRTTEHPEFTLHIVGASATSVQTVLELIKLKFVIGGFATAPTVTGRVNKNAYWRSPLPIQNDTSVTPWLTYAVVEVGWTSDPA